MTTFNDTDHLYRVLDAFFQKLAAEEEVATPLVESGAMVLRMRYRDPEGQVTVDLRQAPISWAFGDDNKQQPDLELIQDADVAHQFWLGRLNITRAVATRKVVARGPVSKALRLLPALKPAYPLYAQVLQELGEHALLPREDEAVGGGVGAALSRAWRYIIGMGSGAAAVDFEALNAHYIPLEDDPAEPEVSYRDAGLPEDEEALGLAMYERMLLIRAFELKLSEANAAGEIPTEAIHLSVGQEAVAVGACFSLRADDHIATTHRGHGHMLAKGADLYGMMAEILGKADGLCQGKGGSMHVTEAAVGAIGANGIVGASPLMAAGAAQSARLRGTDQVAVAFMGDGATNQGMFHEALNLAAVFDLPAVFVVENNLYGEFTPQSKHMRIERISDRAASYGMPGQTVDGNDVTAVYQAMTAAVARARAGEGPTLLECLTYRWHGHMEGEQIPYRTAEELTSWKERCPIAHQREVLVAAGALDAEAAAELEQQATAAVEAVYARAQEADDPTAASLTTDVYAPEPAALYTAQPVEPAEREVTCSRALLEALAEEMERDDRVYLLGEDVSTGGYFAVTAGLTDMVGADRVLDTPISEYAIAGSAVGAALTGCRPVVEILFSDFLTTCMDPLVNQAAKLRYMSGGQYRLPMVVRTPGGGGLGMAAQHSQSFEALLTGVPGLVVAAPATPYDAKGMLKAAIRSNNPVLLFEHKLLYTVVGPVPEGDYLVPLGLADVKRPGRDVTVVSVGAALGKVLDVADQLERQGISVEVVDLRTLVPLDMATVARSVQRTGRLVTVEDGPLCHGFGAEVVARAAEALHGVLRAAPRRVAALDVPIPYCTDLEELALPDEQRIMDAIKATL